jgi:hypothetical protein
LAFVAFILLVSCCSEFAYHINDGLCACVVGTTIAGVHELEKAGVRAAFMNAVVAAANRADELSKT